MSVLIFIDHAEGHIKKTSLEALSYGVALAEQIGVSAEGILLGTVQDDLTTFGAFGVKKIHQQAQVSLNVLDPEAYIRLIAGTMEKTGASVLVLSHTNTGRALAPGLSAKLKAADFFLTSVRIKSRKPAFFMLA